MSGGTTGRLPAGAGADAELDGTEREGGGGTTPTAASVSVGGLVGVGIVTLGGGASDVDEAACDAEGSADGRDSGAVFQPNGRWRKSATAPPAIATSASPTRPISTARPPRDSFFLVTLAVDPRSGGGAGRGSGGCARTGRSGAATGGGVGAGVAAITRVLSAGLAVRAGIDRSLGAAAGVVADGLNVSAAWAAGRDLRDSARGSSG